ncbi:MAG: hypothetical protein QF879_11085 [Candidatus Latescibacteria bacterium]|nr:hypothetical protein [Candidatus Latescibacterota bacterium]
MAAFAPNCLLDDEVTIHKPFKEAVAINPDGPPMIRISAPRHDRKKPYIPQSIAARSGFAVLIETARIYRALRYFMKFKWARLLSAMHER